MKYFILFLYFSFAIKNNAQYLWQVYPDKIVKWNYYDGDEFNREEIDNDKWLTHQPWGRPVLGQDIIYVSDNITFDKGNAQFLIKIENKLFKLENWEFDTSYVRINKIPVIESNKINFKYTGGCLWAKKKFKLGYFEIKFKAAEGQGPWPSFWLYGGEPNNEIDFFELKGEKEKQIHVDAHCPDGCGNYIHTWYEKRGWGHWVKVNRKLKSGYNIIAGEWTKEYVKWFLNGQLIAYSNHSFDLPMLLTLGTGIAKNDAPFEPGPNAKTPFPNYFYVDYMRIYKTDTLPDLKGLKKQFAEKLYPPVTDSVNTLRAANSKKKLKNNRDKKVGSEKSITLSILQLNKNNFSLRILGVTPKDVIDVSISGENDRLIKKIKVQANTEILIPTGEEKKIILHAEINKQIINESVDVQ